MKATFHVQFVKGRGYRPSARAVALTQAMPRAPRGSLVVKLIVTLPDDVFEPMVGTVDVGADQIRTVTVEAEGEAEAWTGVSPADLIMEGDYDHDDHDSDQDVTS